MIEIYNFVDFEKNTTFIIIDDYHWLQCNSKWYIKYIWQPKKTDGIN